MNFFSTFTNVDHVHKHVFIYSMIFIYVLEVGNHTKRNFNCCDVPFYDVMTLCCTYPTRELHVPSYTIFLNIKPLHSWYRQCNPLVKVIRISRLGAITVSTILAPVSLTIFRSNSKFDQNLQCSSLKCTLPTTTKFCTRHDSVTVVTCAKFRCDRLSIFETRALPIFIEFRIRSKYR